MAKKRTYEIVFMLTLAEDAEVMRLTEAVQKIITDQGAQLQDGNDGPATNGLRNQSQT